MANFLLKNLFKNKKRTIKVPNDINNHNNFMVIPDLPKIKNKGARKNPSTAKQPSCILNTL